MSAVKEGASPKGSDNEAAPISLWRRIRRRCLGGAVALSVLALVVFVDSRQGPPWFAIGLAVTLGLLSAFELGRMFSNSRRFRDRLGSFPSGLILAGAAALFGLKIHAYIHGGDPIGWTLAVFAIFSALFLIREVIRGDQETGVDAAAAATLSLACLLLFSFVFDLLLGVSAPDGVRACLYVILVSKSNDIGGYLVGNAVGGPKLAPKVSPGKTRSGSLGGLLLGILVAFLLAEWAGFGLGIGWTLAFAVFVGMANQLGDLSESLIKRACEVKDSGGYLPTFGGALDMIDSLVFAAPVGYWFGVTQGGFVLP